VTAANYPACLQFTLRYEGGNSDDPGDPGGRTRKGITQATYNAYRARKGLAHQDVFTMLDPEMQEIYRNQYWNIVNGDGLRAGEDLCVFDFAVNSGPARAKNYWSISGGSRSAVDDLITKLCESRLLFLKGLGTWGRFGHGWAARVQACESTAHKMAEAPAHAPEPIPQAPAPAPQVPAPPVPAPARPAPVAPAGLPPVSAAAAGRITAVLDNLTALHASYLAERAAYLANIDAEIAVLETTIADFGKLQGAAPAASPAVLQIPAAGPAVVPPTRSQTVLGITNWKTTLSGVVGVISALATLFPQTKPYAEPILGFAVSLGLISAKDANVTGGTVPATLEAAARALRPPIK
jgi:lysozyme family protein